MQRMIRLVFVGMLVLSLATGGCAAPPSGSGSSGDAPPSQEQVANYLKFWERHFQAGGDAFLANDYKLAEKELQLALKNLKSARIEDQRLGMTLHRLGSVYLVQQKFPESEKMLKQALDLEERYLGEESPEVAKTLNNLGKLYSARGKFVKAAPLLERALAINEKSLKENDTQLIIPLINLGIVYYKQSNFTQAEACFDRALAVAEANHSSSVSTILQNLADVYRKTNRLEQAEATEAKIKAMQSG